MIGVELRQSSGVRMALTAIAVLTIMIIYEDLNSNNLSSVPAAEASFHPLIYQASNLASQLPVINIWEGKHNVASGEKITQ